VTPCLVAFHAHPDDEAIFTGGTIVRAVRSGWRVVLVVATSGESGRSPGWVGDDLAAHRRAETDASARLLGVDRVEFLPYRDSGADPVDPAGRRGGPGASATLAGSSVLEAAARLRTILIDEHATVLTSYDGGGIYGHRDHVRVHEIAAAAVLDTLCDLVEATVSRTALRALRADLVARGLRTEAWPEDLLGRVGVEDTGDLVAVDVTEELPVKLRALAAHASQVVEAQSFMGLPPGAFHRLLGVEWFRTARVVDGRFSDLVAAVPA
jgi:LmbE family N-acetylglucosaminyl deacetylase